MSLNTPLAELKRTIARQPDDRVSLTKLGFELVASNPTEAQRQLARVIPLSAGSLPAARLNLGIAQEAAGQPVRAEQNYRAVLNADSNNAKALRRLVRLLSAARRTDDLAAVLAPPGRADILNDENRILAGALLAAQATHKDLAAGLLRPLLSPPNQFFPAALRLCVDHRLLDPDDQGRRYDLLRTYQVFNPNSLEGAVEVGRSLHDKRRLVRAAGWICHASVLAPDRDDILATAAAEAAKVVWPRHGIATNRRLHERFPSAIEPIERMRTLYKELEAKEEAKEAACRMVDNHPDLPTVWDECIKILNEFELYEDADRLWVRAIEKFPGIPVLHYNRGLSCSGQGRKLEAIDHIRRSICIDPRYTKGWNGLSLAYINDEDVDDAIFYAERGRYVGTSLDILNLNLGVYYRAKRRYADSVRALDLAQSLSKDPHERAASLFNIGMIKFCVGEIEAGFQGYMHRWATKNFPSPKRNFKQPIWNGPVKSPNAHLLTYMEQGLGDEVMFSWYIPLVRKDVKSLTVDCDSRMIPIFTRSFPGATFVPRSRKGDPATRDESITHKAPIGHVPAYYAVETKTYIAGIPAEQREPLPIRNDGYLIPDPELVSKWRDHFATKYPGRACVGVSWRSSIRNRQRNLQYLEIDELATVFPPGTVVVNLQYNSRDEDVAIWRAEAEARGFIFEPMAEIDLKDDIEDIFAILKVLNGAVTPLLSLAWMSAAVGCPTLVNRTAWDKTIWQSFGTDFVPWQPSMRLFFRTPKEAWADVLERMAGSLRQLIERDL